MSAKVSCTVLEAGEARRLAFPSQRSFMVKVDRK
jgi:hypothetical protein